MRQVSSLLLITGALLGIPNLPLHAQEQERGLQQRLLEPDQTLEFRGWKEGFNPGKSAFSSSKARVKEFQFEQKVRPEKYVTRDFRGTKGAWEGDFLFKTEEANTEGRYLIPKKDTEYETSAMKTDKLSDGDKKARTQKFVTGEATLRGKAQGSIDAEYHQNKKPMSIDDVRELLNKSK